MFRFLLALKHLLGALFFWLRFPASWLWGAVLKPSLLLGYRSYLFGRKIIDILLDELRHSMVSFFTSRHVVQSVAVLIAFFVTATNLRAAGVAAASDGPQDQSVFAVSHDANSEEILVEDSSAVIPAVESVDYMGDQAVAPQDALTGSGASGVDSAGSDVDAESPETILNALRPLPQTDDLGRPSTRTSIVEYTVQMGDTVSSIAIDFDLDASTILQSNGLDGRGFIKPGQVLKILPVDGILYTIKKGDNLSAIVKKYKSDADKVMEINRLADAGDLTVGENIILPDGILPALPAPPPPARLGNLGSIFSSPKSGSASVGRLLWPAGVRRITQYFRGAAHTGLDIAGPIGTPIYAAETGTVIYAGWNSGGYGNMIIIDHGGGLFTRYGHSSKLLVHVGDTVQRGDQISLMGSTGRSTGPHLHFEVMTGNVRHRLNPLDYIK